MRPSSVETKDPFSFVFFSAPAVAEPVRDWNHSSCGGEGGPFPFGTHITRSIVPIDVEIAVRWGNNMPRREAANLQNVLATRRCYIQMTKD